MPKRSAEATADAAATSLKKGRSASVEVPISEDDPVLSVSATNRSPIDPSSSTLLQDLLGKELPRGYFLSNLFCNKAVHIAIGSSTDVTNDITSDIVQNYLFNLDMKHILEETSSDNIFVWLTTKDANDRDGNKSRSSTKGTIRSIELSDPQSALALFQCGHAIYCRAPPELEQPLVSSLLRDTGLGCGQYDPTGERSTVLGRGEVEVFAAGQAGHVTNWHTDFQQNFTIQLSGQKRWFLKQGRATHPLRGCTPHYQSPDAVEGQLKSARMGASAAHFEFRQPDETNSFGNEESVLLRPGHVLYHPAGIWHKVETVEPGVAINVSLMATNYATLFCQSLQHLLLKQDGWRAAVTSNSVTGSAAEKLEELMNGLPAILTTFQKNGGAQAILPPVLLHPPPFEVINNADEDATGDENIDKDGKDDCDEPMIDEAEDIDSTSIASSEGAGWEQGIVDCDSFDLPESAKDAVASSVSGTKRGAKLLKNPLALLMPFEGITSYYSCRKTEDKSSKEGNADAKDDADSDAKELYVLNVNYAGNEVHESCIRTVLKTDVATNKDILDKLCSNCSIAAMQEAGGLDKSNFLSCEEGRSLLSCLVYYGYFVCSGLSKSSSS